MSDQYAQEYLQQTFDTIHTTSFDVNQPSIATYLARQHTLPSHDCLPLSEHTSADYFRHCAQDWLAPLHQHQQDHAQRRYTPTSVRSSTSTNTRSSDNSVFSRLHLRDSIASTNTTWSQFSQTSREYYLSQAESQLNANSSLTCPQTFELDQEPAHKQTSHRGSQRQGHRTKDPFTTCVSRKPRSRRSGKNPRFWCTSCREGFQNKYDWIRHEETFQERCDTYRCDLCKKTYFLDKDFVHHHKESHRCHNCAEHQTRPDNQHLQFARRKRRGRLSWGCGLCLHCDTNWTDRCNHVAQHFEKKGDTIAGWTTAQVILSLLQQPHLREEWDRLVTSTQEQIPYFTWSRKQAGRAEGYPDSDRQPQLQDKLEFFTPDQDASALVALAYEMGHQPQVGEDRPQAHDTLTPHSRTSERMQISRSNALHFPPLNKELPLLPASPPVPPKDIQSSLTGPTAASVSFRQDFLQELSDAFVPWDSFTHTILEDDVLPEGEPMDLCGLDLGNFDHLNSDLDPSNPSINEFNPLI